jgi:glutathione S-transferase
MTVLAAHLAGRDYLLDRFSVADAYLTVVLNWTMATKTDLAQWPVVQAYHRRMLQRPSIARAVAEERALYAEEQARRAAA